MLDWSLVCLCICLGMVGMSGWPVAAQAQSDSGAVLLPPAPIPSQRSRPAAPRANFGAPNPVARPVIEDQADLDQAALDGDERAPVLPPVPESTPVSDQTPADPDSPALTGENPLLSRELPPNPTPRGELTSHTLAYGEVEPAFPVQIDESTVVLPTTEPAAEPDYNPACQQALRAAGAVFEPRGRVEGAGQCGVDDAVALRAIGDIRLQPAALIACPTATSFTAFVQETITPEALSTMGAAPRVIYVAASYSCRGRNNVPGARMSEHAFGRAVDVRALELEDGQSWHVRPHAAGSQEPAAQFQAAVRGQACGPFNTVLGPGSDGHHGDHIHFDMAIRSSSYCR